VGGSMCGGALLSYQVNIWTANGRLSVEVATSGTLGQVRSLTARSTSLCSGGISPAVAPPGLCNRHFQELRYYHGPSVHALERRLVSEQRQHFSEPCSAQQRVGGDGETLLEAVPSEPHGTYAQRSHTGVIPHGAVGWIHLAQHGRRAITTARVRRVWSQPGSAYDAMRCLAQ
jgi:hypothetical protein